MSDLQNPDSISLPPEASLESQGQSSPTLQVHIPGEDPSWGWLEIVGILLVGFAAFVFLFFLMSMVAHRFFYPQEPFYQILANHPIWAIATQSLDYAVVVGFMVLLLRWTSNSSFGKAIRWNWPTNSWLYLAGGLILCIIILILQRYLPMPKEVPMDRLFRTSYDAWVVSVFGLLLAPLVEEFFFRGILYPVLARRVGMVISILLTALFFGSVHALQLGFAWGPVLIIVLVGLVLTTIRALTKSVATGWLIHIAYNGTIFIGILIGTAGFRHMERLKQ